MLSCCLAESTLHTLDPFVFELTPGVGPRWYGLAYAAGFLSGWCILRELAKRGRIPFSTRDVGDLIFCLMIGVVLGGRLGHCLFYEPHFFIEFGAEFPYWRILAVHQGGMSSHGGVLGVAIACLWFARTRSVAMLVVVDAVAFVAPLGLCFGRLANWVNAELWGKPLAAVMQLNPPWWSVKYPDEVFYSQWNGSTEFAAERIRLGSAFAMQQYVRDEAYAGNAVMQERLLPTLTAYWPINFMQALSEGVIVFILLAILWATPRRPGLIAGAFLILYGTLRVTTEQFRQADADYLTFAGVTVPMQLSALMVASGVALLVASKRQQLPRIGGWWRRA